jgi:serine/threonine protein kinase
MVYGKTPFSHLSVIHKLQKIVDSDYAIDYPVLNGSVKNPFLVPLLQNCLKRNPKERCTIPELLEHPFLRPDNIMMGLMKERRSLLDQCRKYVLRAIHMAREKPDIDKNNIWDAVKNGELHE